MAAVTDAVMTHVEVALALVSVTDGDAVGASTSTTTLTLTLTLTPTMSRRANEALTVAEAELQVVERHWCPGAMRKHCAAATGLAGMWSSFLK